MEFIKNIEKQLESIFKGAPKIPENGRKSIVEIMPWIALVFGILQLLAAWALYGLTKVAVGYIELADQISRAYGGSGVGLSSGEKTFIYVGIILVLIDAVILLMAFPKLQQKLKSGWDLLFLASLLNVVYAVASIFMNGRGIGSFILSLIGSAIGFWILYQIKDHYKSSASTTSAAPKS
ncbi:MAG: hypothetical protein AAB459_03660 [Patescibacteria group bacterium]